SFFIYHKVIVMDISYPEMFDPESSRKAQLFYSQPGRKQSIIKWHIINSDGRVVKAIIRKDHICTEIEALPFVACAQSYGSLVLHIVILIAAGSKCIGI